eukprot:364640-Chlamydomonas_euryale.AAC.26
MLDVLRLGEKETPTKSHRFLRQERIFETKVAERRQNEARRGYPPVTIARHAPPLCYNSSFWSGRRLCSCHAARTLTSHALA